MYTTTVNKTLLLETIKQNRAKHREIVQEAFTEYREMAIKELDKMIAEAKSGKRIRRALTLVEPMDQTKEYDQAIRKLEMSVHDTIEIDDATFRQLVCDDWAWKQGFLISNSNYSQKALPQD